MNAAREGGPPNATVAVAALHWGWVPLVELLAVGCFEPTLCTTSVEPAVTVVVTDSITGGPAADGAAGAISEAGYVDSLRPSVWDGSGRLTALQAGLERPGTYRVELMAPGYAAWVRQGVVARSGECHVETVSLEARLQATIR